MNEDKNNSQSRDNTTANSKLPNEHENAKRLLLRQYGLSQILGQSAIIREIKGKIDKISSCDVNVLISGESGTGKELAARAIHYLSHRYGGPFIPVNCAAIPETLFEAELFGHVKGAFTDARLHRTGLVKAADQGTLFLDEVASIHPYTQVKLLRLLQNNGEYRPLGSSATQQANVRIIAATNKNIENLIKEKEFREDFFYRLNVVSLYLPPLRERREDIPILVDFFLKKYTQMYGKGHKRLSAEAIELLQTYPWHGNVRELENKIQQVIVMSTKSVIHADDIDLPTANPKIKGWKIEHIRIAKQNFEKEYLTKLLVRYNGNVADAARTAGTSRTAFWNLLKKHSISAKQYRPT